MIKEEGARKRKWTNNIEVKGRRRREVGSRLSEKTEKGGNGEKEKNRRLVFWNVAGIGSKNIEFWKYIKTFDGINLSETWLNEEG